MTDPTPPPPRTGRGVRSTADGRWRRRGAVAVIFGAALGVMLRPGPWAMTRTLPNLGDPAFITWVTEWGRRALWHRPGPVFDAPVYWPARLTLAYSENMLAAVPFTGALRGFGAGWALTYNLLVVACLAGSLAATYTLARHVVGRTVPAVLAALGFTFSGYTLTHLGHAQLLAIGGFALGLWAVLRMLEERRWWQAVVAGSVLPFFTYFALYYAAVWTVVLPAVIVADLAARRFRPGPRFWPLVAVVVAVSAVGAAPGALAYRQLQHEVDFERELVPQWGLDAVDLVTPAPGSYLWRPLDRAFASRAERWEHTFFPGFVILGFGAAGAATLVRPGPRRRRLLGVVVAGAVSVALALGPEVRGVRFTPFRLLYDHVPGFNGIRVAARLAVPGLLALCVLAAAGLAALGDRLRAPWRSVVGVGAGVLLLAELAAPIPRTVLPTGSAHLAVYRALARRPAGVVVELPMPDPADGTRWAVLEAPRLLYATIDWHPRLNGYSGSWPPSYRDDAAVLARLPSAVAQARLRERCVRYVVLHVGPFAGQAQFGEAEASRIARGLARGGATVRRFGPDRLADLGPAPGRCRADARSPAPAAGRLGGS